jgi:methionyl-tRNA formyltransferase
MDDPIQTNNFIKAIIRKRKKDIVGLAITSGDRLTIKKNRSKLEYIISLLLIMGLFAFIKNSSIVIKHKVKKKISKLFPFVKDPTILEYAKKEGIRTWEIKNPNDKNFINEIKNLEIDVIINQSQNIVKKELLMVPKIGIINRHNSLLPKNRGRLTPFWVLYNEEKETGVSIHFVTEELDAGEIIVQEKYQILENDNFNTLVKRNYELAPFAMLKALDILEKGNGKYLPNPKELATYNTTPSLKEAWIYRKKIIKRSLNKILNRTY